MSTNMEEDVWTFHICTILIHGAKVSPSMCFFFLHMWGDVYGTSWKRNRAFKEKWFH